MLYQVYTWADCTVLVAAVYPRTPDVGRRYFAVGRSRGTRARPDHRVRGKPLTIVSDNGTELTSMAILKCIEWHYIAPGNRSRTALWNRPMVAFATDASMKRCSRYSLQRSVFEVVPPVWTVCRRS